MNESERKGRRRSTGSLLHLHHVRFNTTFTGIGVDYTTTLDRMFLALKTQHLSYQLWRRKELGETQGIQAGLAERNATVAYEIAFRFGVTR